ncbi:MAG: tRNA 2-thiouridine(34) synthase MnmA [Deltaproteobacteria bacterium]|nr:tRNA 2-thiouridine(34) synthase MnmA [Deltaproteobacteria bacterium]
MSRLKKKAIVALSGGVDSAVSAALLIEQGFEVEALTMAVVPEAVPAGGELCEDASCSKVIREARKVADFLHIPLHTVMLEKDFRDLVIEPFLREYLAGRTPNPCVVCNRFVKFGLLQETAVKLGADVFATGHYALIRFQADRYLLHKGVDQKKDQSYFLFALQQSQLARTVFPLGFLTKDQVRKRAEAMALPVSQREESQDICFIPQQDYVAYLEAESGVGPVEGDIVHASGKVLGRHQGTWRYTIGQRKGLGIAWAEPLFVLGINAAANRVIVGEKRHLAVGALKVRDVNWLIRSHNEPFRCRCRIRYRHREAPALVTPGNDGSAEVVFDQAQEGVTPGQAAVFYQDDLVAGGGWIV